MLESPVWGYFLKTQPYWLVPLALKGVAYKPMGAGPLLARNLAVYGLGGLVAPFIGIKLIDLAVGGLGLA